MHGFSLLKPDLYRNVGSSISEWPVSLRSSGLGESVRFSIFQRFEAPITFKAMAFCDSSRTAKASDDNLSSRFEHLDGHTPAMSSVKCGALSGGITPSRFVRSSLYAQMPLIFFFSSWAHFISHFCPVDVREFLVTITSTPSDRKMKLCTCVGMRRRYPGHKSYGLGKLCAIYDIELEDHHRALCDARAAARLLNLINKKRDDGISAEPVQAA